MTVTIVVSAMVIDIRGAHASAPPAAGRVALRPAALDAVGTRGPKAGSLTLDGFTAATRIRGRPAAPLSLDDASAHPFARSHRAWRARVPFGIPVDPDFMSYDPQCVHSAVLRYTSDKGVVASRTLPAWAHLIDVDDPDTRAATFARLGLPADMCPEERASYHARRLVISRDVERGLRGASLSKHSHAYLASTAATFPGITPNIGARASESMARRWK
jgi:hypothetical protein